MVQLFNCDPCVQLATVQYTVLYTVYNSITRACGFGGIPEGSRCGGLTLQDPLNLLSLSELPLIDRIAPGARTS